MREQDRASGRAWIQVGSVPGRLEETSWSVHTCSTKARAPEDIWTPPKTSGNPSSSTISRLETTAASPWELQGRRADVWMLEASKMSGSELGQCCRTARPVPDLGQFPPPPADFSRARPAHRHRPGPRRARGCGTGPIPRAVLEKSPPQCQILDNSPRPPPILPAPAPRTATARGPAGPVGAVRARSHGPFSRNRRPSAQVLSAIVCPRRPCFSQACICCPALSFFNQCFFPVCFSPPLFLLFALFFFCPISLTHRRLKALSPSDILLLLRLTAGQLLVDITFFFHISFSLGLFFSQSFILSSNLILTKQK